MFCQKCGSQNPDDVTFCSKCGNNLKSVQVESERKGITGKLRKMGIPGFRSGTTWKMILAILVYIFIGIPILLIFSGFISSLVFGVDETQTRAPMLNILTSNYLDTSGADIIMQHKGGDDLKGGEWKLSIVEVGQPALFKTSNLGSDFFAGKKIIATTITCNDGVVTDQIVNGCTPLVFNKTYHIQFVHIPSNALVEDSIVEVKSEYLPSSYVTTSPSATQSNPSEIILKVGESATDTGIQATVISAQKTKSYNYENSQNEVKVETAKSGKIFILADLEIKNVGSEKVFPIGDFSVTDSEGYKYERSPNLIFTYKGNDRLPDQELFPNQKSRGKLSFIIPENAQGLKLQYDFRTKWASWLIE